MATKHLCLLLLLTLLSSTHIHARETQMFNKIPSKVNENVVKEAQAHNKQQQAEEITPLNTNEQQQEPNFIPQNENSYGLYGHESGQLPPSTTTTTTKGSNFPYNAKYLPKNYNTVAYVTEPEDFDDSSNFEEKSFTNSENNNFYNGGNNFYNGMKDSEFMDGEYINTENRNNYNGFNNYNLQQNNLNNNNNMMDNNNYNLQQNNLNNNNHNMMNNNNNLYNGGRMNRVQPQGMSDTRFLENGKYYYDINAGRHSRDPTETAKEFALRNQYNPRGYYGNNNQNSYQYNNYMEGGQQQYHDEDDMP